MTEILHITSINQVHRLVNLGKPVHPLISIIKLDNNVDPTTFEDQKLVVDLYQISLKQCTSGSFLYGRNEYDFEEGTLVFSKPGQVFQLDKVQIPENRIEGWTLFFHPDLIHGSNLGQSIDAYPFFSYEANEALHLSDKEKGILQALISNIDREIDQNIDAHSQELIVHNIESILKYCLRYYDRQFYTRTKKNQDIVAKFEQLLEVYFDSDKPIELGLPSVKYCSHELGLSSYYLSDLLKKETGRNTIEHIHFFVLDKAKSKLLNTTGSISEIAYDLGFDYPQHFAKLFKNKTGLSPKEFRQRVQ